MSDILILIDDEPSFVDSFNIETQRNGYRLASSNNLNGLKELLLKFEHRSVSVVLDVKCLIEEDQEIERADFIGAALNYLNQNYPYIPRLILTGDDKALEGVKFLFNPETEDIYTKSGEDIEAMFVKIAEHQRGFSERKLDADTKDVIQLLKKGEQDKIEFKSSLRYCTKENRKDKKLQYEVLKNIAAFLNTVGGTLLIGVDDEANVTGLENTDFLVISKEDKLDGFRLILDDLLAANFGNTVHPFIDVSIVKVDSKTICRIKVIRKFSKPAYINYQRSNGPKYQAFFIRGKASARELKEEQDQREYIKESWPDLKR